MTGPLLLDVAYAALAASFAVTKSRVPGDRPEDHEDNTYHLPEGVPVRRKLRAFFREQLKLVVGRVAKLGHPLDSPLPKMGDWDDPMASVMTPIIGAYWDKAGRGLRGRLGLDADGWRVTDPNIHRAIQAQSLKFCRSTNATTDLGLAEAREAVRDQLARGLIGEGQTIPELTNRIRSVFTRASRSRAELIARTETARAVHAASEMSAIASGVVSAKRIMLSANSCPVCVAMAERSGAVPLGSAFGTIGHDADYSSIKFPPIHPNCRCSVSYALIDDSPPVAAYDPKGKPAGRPPAAMEGEGGLAEGNRFVRNPLRRAGAPKLVLADVAKLDAALAADPAYHVGPGGSGPSAVAGRYEAARRFLAEASEAGHPVHATEVHLDKQGTPRVGDGRHRFAALRDSGATAVPVAVPRSQVDRFRRRFGRTPRGADSHAT